MNEFVHIEIRPKGYTERLMTPVCVCSLAENKKLDFVDAVKMDSYGLNNCMNREVAENIIIKLRERFGDDYDFYIIDSAVNIAFFEYGTVDAIMGNVKSWNTIVKFGENAHMTFEQFNQLITLSMQLYLAGYEQGRDDYY